MRILIASLLLMITPTVAIIAYKEFGNLQKVQRDVEREAAHAGASESHGGGGEVLFFNATWCGPCRQMKPIVADMRRKGYRMRDVDVDRHRALAQKYNVRSIPTFVFLERGKEVKRFSGGTSSERLHQLCSSPIYR